MPNWQEFITPKRISKQHKNFIVKLNRRIDMAKNIMLLFISPTHVNPKTNCISQAEYDKIGTTFTTNESAVLYVSKLLNPNKLDKIFAFASQMVLKNSIKASDTPKDEKTGENLTHYQYFKYRLKEANLNTEELLTEDTLETKGSVYHYDEMSLPEKMNERAVWKSMGQIVEMAVRIQTYVQEVRKDNPNEEVILHVDCTGGLRDAAMMIMAIMRLMQYQNITIGKVLYSNYDGTTRRGKVEEVNEIYQMFDLIAGAEEFVRFGSVDVMRTYFDNKEVPKVLKDLLNAMSKFAEAIKISRRSEFEEALKYLQTAYKNFSEDANKMSTVQDISSLNYKLMQQLEIRISQEYAELLNCKADDYISIIDWCLNHGYLQQALTLYTECFPDLIFEKMVTVIDPTISEYIKTKADKDKTGEGFALLNDYNLPGANPFSKAYNKLIQELRTNAIALINKGTFDIENFKAANDFKTIWEAQGIIESDYNEYIELLKELQELKTSPNLLTDLNTFRQEFPTLCSFQNVITEEIFTEPSDRRVGKIFKTLNEIRIETFKKKKVKTLMMYYLVLTGGIILNVDKETFIKIVDRYFIIKSKRNDSAHANLIPKESSKISDSETSYATILKEYMKQGIEEYRNA